MASSRSVRVRDRVSGLALAATLALALGLPQPSLAAAAAKRIALVIGVSHYDMVNSLPNTLPDAQMIADALKKLGFSVRMVTDPNRKDLMAAVDGFQHDSAGADASVVYFAGHGVEIAGVNYLVPKDASNASVDQMIGSVLETAKVRAAVLPASHVRLVILDACRDTAGVQLSDLKGGLARETGGSTTEVVTLMAAAPGQTALDGADGHSPFARALAEALGRPKLTIGELPRFVQSEVLTNTKGRQSPDLQGIWVDIYWSFDPRAVKGAAADESALDRSKREKAFWQSIRNSSDPADFRAYLDAADRGDFAGLYRPIAVDRLDAIQRNLKPAAGGENTASLDAVRQAREAFGRGDYTGAVAAWTAAAGAGNSAAMYNLGVMSFTGRGTVKDQVVAASWFARAAGAGHTGGMINYGLSLMNGYGVAQNQAEGVKWLRKAADAGLPSAMGLVGQLYLQGQGVRKDPRQAAGWLQRAADAGDGPSMVDLADLYDQGEGVAQDKKKAAELYLQAANAGESAGMVRLGYAYEDGVGVEKDPVQAATWYQRAAEAGDGEGMSALAVMFENGRGLSRDYGRAAEYYRLAANRNDPRGLLGLGSMYAQGEGVAQDDPAAAMLFQRASDAGSASATRNLGIMYESGRGVPRDVGRAEALYRKAVAQGDAGAADELARLKQQ
jgi:TPR repeat protein